MERLAHLSNEALLRGLHSIVGSHRLATAELVLHLGEVDARRLHVNKGFSSLFRYCVEELAFSEDEACRRIDAARLARKFPCICALLESGSVSLTVLGLVKPHLTEANHEELLEGLAGSSSRQAKEWLAARFPAPDVPTSIRKLPARPATATLPPTTTAPVATTAVATTLPTATAPAAPRIDGAPAGSDLGHGVPPLPRQAPWAGACAPARARIEPLSRDRFLVKFTASRELRDKLELARDLMSHANPGGELTVVLERAIDLLVADLRKKKLGHTSRRRKEPQAAKDATLAGNAAPARRVTRAARREVLLRDGFRCSFVADDGRRCDARAFLEFDHETPKGRGGDSSAENLRLLCRAHNRAEAERTYGETHVARAIARSRNGPGSRHGARDGGV